MSAKNILDIYLKEVTFPYSTKKETAANRFNLLLTNRGGKLAGKVVLGKDMAEINDYYKPF